jgi:DNA-binding NarL/FixJ family response regulator
MNLISVAPVSVLVVDDSTIVRQRLCTLLSEDARVNVVGEVGGVAAAWKLFEQLRPDAVVLDLQLQDGSGIEVLQRIKKARPSCRAIILTNLCEAPFRRECLRRGADYFLHKATEFERVIPLLLERAAGSRPRRWQDGSAVDEQCENAVPESQRAR